jgi:two-component system sensor histidine kinase EvgS
MVLMDIQLPDMNGIKTTEKIKKIRPELPVIMQTGFSFYNDDTAPENKIWDDFVLKPVAAGELLNKMMIQYTKAGKQDHINI